MKTIKEGSMKVRDNAEKVIGLAVEQMDAEGRNWDLCYPVVRDGRIVGVVAAEDGAVLAGKGGGEYDEALDYYVIR
jgi:glucose/arabinose dehydrogenase